MQKETIMNSLSDNRNDAPLIKHNLNELKFIKGKNLYESRDYDDIVNNLMIFFNRLYEQYTEISTRSFSPQKELSDNDTSELTKILERIALFQEVINTRLPNICPTKDSYKSLLIEDSKTVLQELMNLMPREVVGESLHNRNIDNYPIEDYLSLRIFENDANKIVTSIEKLFKVKKYFNELGISLYDQAKTLLSNFVNCFNMSPMNI
jgi:hypothetical protein